MRHQGGIVVRGLDDASDDVLDRLATAVHAAASWLPPWAPPEHLVAAAGYDTVHGPPPTGPRCVGVEWASDPQVRGMRTLLAFARVLLREVAGVTDPSPETVAALAGRLLIPDSMAIAARRDPGQPGAHAPREFVERRLAAIPVSLSGTYAAAKVR
jgi:hypothetical protein